jgi:glycerol kinase
MIGVSSLMFMSKGRNIKPLQSCILAIDQGTTSSRVLVIDQYLKVLDIASREHKQISTKPGWVEQDPE